MPRLARSAASPAGAMGRVRVQQSSSCSLGWREHKKVAGARVTVPFRGAAGRPPASACRQTGALGASAHVQVGQRIRVGEAGVGPVRLRRPSRRRATSCSRASSRTSRSRFSYQPQIEPSSGRIVGAEALARSAIARVGRGVVRPGRRRRARRAPVAAGPAQGAAHRRGVGRPAQGPEAVDQPAARGHFARRL